MTYISSSVELFAKMNIAIQAAVSSGGNWAYLIMFIILFAGAAFVFTAPVLPSVSLIFLVASLSVAGLLNPFISFAVLGAAVSLGDLTSYFIGKGIKDKLIDNYKIPFIKKEHINRTRIIYEKADFLSIVFARFTPVIGSVAQLVAGTINHSIRTFCKRNVVGGIIWLMVNFVCGWLIAAIPALKSNFILIFMIVPIGSVFVSVGYYITKNYLFTSFLKRA